MAGGQLRRRVAPRQEAWARHNGMVGPKQVRAEGGRAGAAAGRERGVWAEVARGGGKQVQGRVVRGQAAREGHSRCTLPAQWLVTSSNLDASILFMQISQKRCVQRCVLDRDGSLISYAILTVMVHAQELRTRLISSTCTSGSIEHQLLIRSQTNTIWVQSHLSSKGRMMII